jgi:hypothetical protein
MQNNISQSRLQHKQHIWQQTFSSKPPKAGNLSAAAAAAAAAN